MPHSPPTVGHLSCRHITLGELPGAVGIDVLHVTRFVVKDNLGRLFKHRYENEPIFAQLEYLRDCDPGPCIGVRVRSGLDQFREGDCSASRIATLGVSRVSGTESAARPLRTPGGTFWR